MLTRIQKQDNHLLKDEEKTNQAHLMALNTLFEAARAGKAGESLAVLADKIKSWIQYPSAGHKKARQPNKA